MQPHKLVIIGSGPAGFTAAIYAARGGLNPILYEGKPKQNLLPGGQLIFTTDVENFPGFPEGVQGPELMDAMKKQAERFNTKIITDDIVQVNFNRHPFILTDSQSNLVYALSVIIATGARANWMNLPREQELSQSGGGVSACAICDGALPIFRNQPLAVIGGGDTAMEEADYLSKFGSEIHLIHRRNQFRASQAMQERVLNNPKIKIHWNQVVTKIIGDPRIDSIELEDIESKQTKILKIKGMFVAIGQTPNTEFLTNQLDLDRKKYIITRQSFRTYTSVDGVFAAGDVIDPHYRQAVTSAGTGCMAALDAQHWLSSKEFH